MSAADQEIIASLEGGRWIKGKYGKKIWNPYQLYVVARRDNSKLPDWNCWGLTYSGSRPCAQGPFPLVQVQRLIESGLLEADFVDSDGYIQSYILCGNRDPK